MAAGFRRVDDPRWFRCDVGGLREPDLLTVNTLARLALACRRQGQRLLLVHASPALVALVSFAGLEEVLCLDREGPASPGGPAGRTAGRTGRCRGRR